MKQIGEIISAYGGLHVKEVDGRYFWAIENYTGLEESFWQEIPKTLYDELLKFDNEGMPKVDAEVPKSDITCCDTCRKNNAEATHGCPFAEDVHDDYEKQCNCCEDCQQECRDSI